MRDKAGCIIVDDEFGAREILENYVSKVPWLTLLGSFADPLEGLNYIQDHTVHIAFLDINMPQLGGLQLARMIQRSGIQVIFCTAYSQHAVESYELEALDYLLKPIPFDRFLSAVNKIPHGLDATVNPESETNSESTPGSLIFVKSGNQIHQIDLSDIQYIKKDGHYVIIKLKHKELLSRMSFSELTELLPAADFVQVHRSYMVPLAKIQTIQKQFIHIGEKEIPIGDSFKQAFFERVAFHGN